MRRIIYMITGRAHLPYLVVSLKSLTDYWDGPIDIYVWPESEDAVHRIAEDKRLGNIRVRPRTPEYRGKNGQSIDKIIFMQQLEKDEIGLYIDADTMIRGPVVEMFEMVESHAGFVATQFCDWKVSGRIMGGRLKRLLDIEGIDKEVAKTLMSKEYANFPSVNSGVFACRGDSRILPKWYEWCWAARTTFISDETSLHLVPIWNAMREARGEELEYLDRIHIMTGGVYNCSVKYRPVGLSPEKVSVWHFHGDSNTKKNKSVEAIRMWFPWYQDCLRWNLGGMQEWRDSCNNGHLRDLELRTSLGEVL